MYYVKNVMIIKFLKRSHLRQPSTYPKHELESLSECTQLLYEKPIKRRYLLTSDAITLIDKSTDWF